MLALVVLKVPGWPLEIKQDFSCWKLTLVGEEETTIGRKKIGRGGGRNKSERCVRAQPFSISSHLWRRWCVLGVVEHIEQQLRSLTPANGRCATSYSNVPLMNQTLSSRNFIVRTWWWIVTTDLINRMVRSPAACLLPVLLRVTSKLFVDRPHNADRNASASSVVLLLSVD